MNNRGFLITLKEFFTSTQTLKVLAFLGFTIIMTAIISSQNFFFQSIIENGISKKDIIAQKTLTVIDVKRTEQHKKEVAQKVDYVLTPAEDDFIKSNLDTLQNSIMQIRKKDVPEDVKREELSLLFDMSNQERKDFVIYFLLKSEDSDLREVFDKANLTLANVLRTGITEKDYERNNIDKIITDNLISNVSKRQVSVIKGLLDQVIVPNLVVDEFATEIARKNAENSVKPYEITIHKGDKIVFEGEPVTRLKRDALRQAGYNVYELNWQGLLAIYVLVFIGTSIFLTYMKFFEKQFLEPRYLMITSVLSIMLAVIAVVMPTGFSPYVLPIPAYVLLLAIFTNPRIAFIAITVLLTVLTIGAQYDTHFLITFILLSIVSMVTISRIRYSRRFDLIKAGFVISISGLIILF